VLSPNKRILHERNERSAHEPKVVRREDLPRDHGIMSTITVSVR
jgi:hypothetical protein